GFPPPGDLPFPPPPGGGLPPGAPPLNPGDVPVDPAAGPDGFDPTGLILVSAESIVGLDVFREGFTRVFGTDVPNQHYDPSGDPFYDDINDNDVHDPDEPTGQFRPMLFNLNDWRSTDLRLYYRRADTNGAIGFEDVDFSADTPLTLDGVALVPRNYKPRLNAFRFGRPNTAINLLTAFLPPEFFDGTHLLVPSTKVDVFSAIAIINLVMDQVFNVEADIDIDGVGPLPKKHMVIDAHMFVAPVGDPFVLLLKGFADRSVVAPPTQ
ncbi:MAG: hypothetical protein ACE5E6_11495, partial [Phycisphaerae bacterium]